jgi:hypothetical protein
MRDDRDYRLDLSAAASGKASAPSQPDSKPGDVSARPFISVHFACCNLYLRIYRSADGTAYCGRCPKCAKPVNVAVGQGGTDARIFRVT